MHDMDDEARKEALGEVLMDELKVIREYLEHITPLVQLIPEMREDIAALKADMHVMKLLYKDHEARITTLELAHPH